jgi:hypothetical protein
VSEYSDLCPGGDVDAFVASTLELIEDIKGYAEHSNKSPLPEPGQIEKELGRLRKALAGLSNLARFELLSRETMMLYDEREPFKHSEYLEHLTDNEEKSVLGILENIVQKKYKRPLRQDGGVRMALISHAIYFFSSHGGVPSTSENGPFIEYVQHLIEDCGFGGDGGYDAGRIIRDYYNLEKKIEAQQ